MLRWLAVGLFTTAALVVETCQLDADSNGHARHGLSVSEQFRTLVNMFGVPSILLLTHFLHIFSYDWCPMPRIRHNITEYLPFGEIVLSFFSCFQCLFLFCFISSFCPFLIVPTIQLRWRYARKSWLVFIFSCFCH
jgi:hypothetical protein